MLVPAADAAKMDRWTEHGIEEAAPISDDENSSSNKQQGTASSSSSSSSSSSGGSSSSSSQKPTSRAWPGPTGQQELNWGQQQIIQPTVRAAAVADSGVKEMGGGWSTERNVAYTVQNSDDCMVPVIAIRNGDGVSLNGLGDRVVALPMKTHCSSAGVVGTVTGVLVLLVALLALQVAGSL